MSNIFENENHIQDSLLRSRLTITSAEIKKLYDLVKSTEDVGFDLTVLITNNKLRMIMNHPLITIESDDYECNDYLDTPTGTDLAQDVITFKKSYNPETEVHTLQQNILNENKPLTIQDVEQIDARIASTVDSLDSLESVLDPVLGKVKDAMAETEQTVEESPEVNAIDELPITDGFKDLLSEQKESNLNKF